MEATTAIRELVSECERFDIVIKARGLGLKTIQGSPYEDIDLNIPRGKVTAFCGESGSGKTALLLTLSGRMASNKGELVINGYHLPNERRKMRRIAGIGFFTRVNDVQPSLMVKTLMAAELELYGKRSNKERTNEYLHAWGLDGIATKRAEKLTAEEYARFGIALGMVSDPKILVVDDIETNLTQHQGRQLMEYLKSLTRGGLTVLVGCTEYEIARCADAIVILSEGAYTQREKVEEGIAKKSNNYTFDTVLRNTIPPIMGSKRGADYGAIGGER